MKITLFGAAGEVTGSCSLVETDAARVLVDFGQHQGTREAADQNRKLRRLIRRGLMRWC